MSSLTIEAYVNICNGKRAGLMMQWRHLCKPDQHELRTWWDSHGYSGDPFEINDKWGEKAVNWFLSISCLVAPTHSSIYVLTFPSEHRENAGWSIRIANDPFYIPPSPRCLWNFLVINLGHCQPLHFWRPKNLSLNMLWSFRHVYVWGWGRCSSTKILLALKLSFNYVDLENWFNK